jgi:hypothetical protein
VRGLRRGRVHACTKAKMLKVRREAIVSWEACAGRRVDMMLRKRGPPGHLSWVRAGV